MRRGILGSIMTLVAGAGVAVGQTVPGPSLAPVPTVGAPSRVEGHPAPPSLQPTITEACPVAGVEVPDEANAFDGYTTSTNPLDRQRSWPCSHWWASAEALFWWTKNGPNPNALVTGGAPGSDSIGILGQPGTTVVIGGRDSDFNTSTGGRFAIGYSSQSAFSTCTVGFEVGGFFLNRKSDNSRADSDAAGNPVLSRPIFDPLMMMETVQRVSSPGAFEGHINVGASSRFWGAEANALISRSFGPDFLVGVRYLRLDEGLAVNQQSTVLAGGVAGFNGESLFAPSTLRINDTFASRNQFYGGQIGLQ